MFDDGIGVGDGRRRRLISTGEQQTARVREILAAGGEEAAEGAVVAAEGLPEEEI